MRLAKGLLFVAQVVLMSLRDCLELSEVVTAWSMNILAAVCMADCGHHLVGGTVQFCIGQQCPPGGCGL